MTDQIARYVLALTSFAPLFLISSLRIDRLSLVLVLAGLGSAGIAAVGIFLRAAKRLKANKYRISSVHDRGPEIAAYLAAYLLPFLLAPEPQIRELFAYGLFLFIAVLILANSEAIPINPTFYILGHRVYRVHTDSGATAFLISRNTPRTGEDIDAVPVGGQVLVGKGRPT